MSSLTQAIDALRRPLSDEEAEELMQQQMTKEPKLRETMWGEMSPDLYGGRTCDRHVARWEVGSVGDKGDSDNLKILSLNAKHFPPGTKIVVSEPHCPNCGDAPMRKLPEPKAAPFFESLCTCGFNWQAWWEEQYS